MGKLFDGNLDLLKVLEKECLNAFHVRQKSVSNVGAFNLKRLAEIPKCNLAQ